MARNSIERLDEKYDLESGGSSFSCTPAGVNTTLTSIYKYDVRLILKDLVLLGIFLYCYSIVLEYLTYSLVSSSRIVF